MASCCTWEKERDRKRERDHIETRRRIFGTKISKPRSFLLFHQLHLVYSFQHKRFTTLSRSFITCVEIKKQSSQHENKTRWPSLYSVPVLIASIATFYLLFAETKIEGIFIRASSAVPSDLLIIRAVCFFYHSAEIRNFLSTER